MPSLDAFEYKKRADAQDFARERKNDLLARDRRIAELEAALLSFYAGHQGGSDPRGNDCQCRDCCAYRAHRTGATAALDALLAKKERDTLEYTAREVRSHLDCTQKYASFTSAMPAVRQAINECAEFLEWKAREVKR